jgi:fucose permease
LLVGLGGHLVIPRIGRSRSIWIGMFGISLSTLLLLAGRNPVVTIGASFLMGLIGSLILAIVPAALADQHGELRTIALSEANTISSLVASCAALMVGWSANLTGNWRLALGIVAVTPIFMFLALGKGTASTVASARTDPALIDRPLPGLFWVYWTTLVLSVSVEFCMIYWGADYLENVLGMVKANAAQSVSLFLAAMILGRWAGSRLVQRFSTRSVVVISILIASVGFLVFWRAENVLVGLIGLFITGLGVANLYPLILSLTIGAANGNTVQASARTTLASGTAILALPLALGWLADAVGIRSAYGVVLLLLVSVFLISQIAGRMPKTSRSTI